MKILFIDILTDDPQLRKRIRTSTYAGETYADRCRRAFGLNKKSFRIIDATRGMFPNLRGFDAVVVGGSVENPVDPNEDKPWMKKTFAFIRQVQSANVPLLGICGGLQFTARALGADVIVNPRGRRIGTQTVTLTKEGKTDPLFTGLPNTFRIAATHRCILKKPLPGWKVLATAKLSPFDAVAISNTIRLVQFHPEMTCTIIKKIITQRKADLQQEKIKRPNVCLADRAGKKILKNFLSMTTSKQKIPVKG